MAFFFITYHIKFFIRCLDFGSHSLNVVVYSVKHGALVDDHGLQFTEDIRQLDDAFGNVIDRSFSLLDGRIVLAGSSLGCLHEGGLGEGLVGIGFHQGWVCVWVLHRGWGTVKRG